MSDPTDTSQMIVGYNPGDFFYSTVSNPPTNATCTTLLSGSAAVLDCNSKFIDNSQNCINLELCKNNAAVKQMYGQSATKWKTDELNYDTLAVYRSEYIFMWNLGIATVGMLIAIYYLYSNVNFTKTWDNAVNVVSKRLPQMSNSITVGGPGTGAEKTKSKNNTQAVADTGTETTTAPKK